MSILPPADCLVHFCSELLYHICHFLSQLLLKRCEVCWGDHVCCGYRFCRCCACSELLECSHSWRRSPTLRYHVKRNSILWCHMSQRECVGRVIKCIQQDWKQGSKCAGVQRCPVCARFNTHTDTHTHQKEPLRQNPQKILRHHSKLEST